MMDLGWSAPTCRVDADVATRGILWQHDQIRVLLKKASAVADAALDGDPNPPDGVASAIGDIRLTMEVHLAFEERVLLPILREDPQVGSLHPQQLLSEHRRQRSMLAALHDEARAHPQLPTLAAKLAFLTAWRPDDMTKEEQELPARAPGTGEE